MRWMIPTMLVLALAAPGVAGAEPRGWGPGHGPGPGFGHGPMAFDPEWLDERFERHGERLAEALDLTADQRAAFDEMRLERFAAARPKLERMRTLGEQLHGLLGTEAPDPAEVGEKMIALHGLREELRAAREGFESEFAALLTEEQKFAWEALRESRPRFGPVGPRFGAGRRGGPPA